MPAITMNNIHTLSKELDVYSILNFFLKFTFRNGFRTLSYKIFDKL